MGMLVLFAVTRMVVCPAVCLLIVFYTSDALVSTSDIEYIVCIFCCVGVPFACLTDHDNIEWLRLVVLPCLPVTPFHSCTEVFSLPRAPPPPIPTPPSRDARLIKLVLVLEAAVPSADFLIVTSQRAGRATGAQALAIGYLFQYLIGVLTLTIATGLGLGWFVVQFWTSGSFLVQ